MPAKKAPSPMEIPSDFAPVAAAFAKDSKVTAGKLMSSYGLMLNGKIFAMFGRGKLVVKLPKQRVDEMIASGAGQPFDPGHGRVMKEWIAIESRTPDWVELAREAYTFVNQVSKLNKPSKSRTK